MTATACCTPCASRTAAPPTATASCRTTGFLAEQAAASRSGPACIGAAASAARRGWGSIGAMKDNAGTDVKSSTLGRLSSPPCRQCSEPWRLDPVTLETLGPDGSWGRKVL
jgi:carotenoid cleavage dioxygenase